MQENYNWRPEALRILSEHGFKGMVYVPLPREGDWAENYYAQVEWELDFLDKAHMIAFWIPRDLKHLPGFTTNVEFGMYLKSKKIVLGYPQGAAKMRYLDTVARVNNVPVYHSLEETLVCAMRMGCSE